MVAETERWLVAISGANGTAEPFTAGPSVPAGPFVSVGTVVSAELSVAAISKDLSSGLFKGDFPSIGVRMRTDCCDLGSFISEYRVAKSSRYGGLISLLVRSLGFQESCNCKR